MHLTYISAGSHSDLVTSPAGTAVPASPALARPGNAGYRAGEPGYRRIAVALFAAGVATFALLYSTQALLPELARAFSLSAAQSTLSLSPAPPGPGAALRAPGPVSEVRGGPRPTTFPLMPPGLSPLPSPPP